MCLSSYCTLQHHADTDPTARARAGQIMELVDRDLSEPYSIFTYRFFLATWPHLCLCAMSEGRLVGVVVCKAENERDRHGQDA